MSNYNFLKDKPTGKDLFESKSHKKIADSIAELILDTKKDNTKEKMIGLEGKWGSGKSNVIKIIEEKLKDSHYIYIYDAWGHQEDLQRRSFLEELTSEICKEELVEDQVYWERKLKDLLARKKKNTTKTIPKLNNAFLVIFITIFLNLRLNKLSTEAIKSVTPDTIETFFRDIVSNEFLKALILEIPRNFLVIIVFIIWRIKKFCQRIKNGKGFLKSLGGLVNDSTELLYFYKNQELERTVNTVTSTKEPSVSEFKNWMEELSNNLAENKKLIVVFDNMDRLPSDKVKELWSSIHTFFAEHNYDNIWTIIPFCRKQIKESFEIEGNNFINKTFSIVYRVSPPAMTDWKSFFMTKFKEAFPELKKEKIIIIRNLYDLENYKINPRDIIIFINELVSLKKVWKEEIPIEYIALFILNKKAILEDPLNQILKGKFIKKSSHLFNDEIENYISALVYNVPVEKGSQVMLSRDIEVSLRNENIEKLKQISSHIDFLRILENVVQHINIEELENTILSLYKILDETKGSIEIKNHIWNVLSNKFYNYEIKEISFKGFFENIILKFNNSNEVLKHILDSYAKIDGINGKAYYDTLIQIEGFIFSNNISFDLYSNLPLINLSENEFISFLGLVEEEYLKYNVSADLEKVEDFYLDKLPNDIDTTLNLNVIKYLTDDYDFTALKNQLEIILENKVNANNLEYIYKLYFNFLDKPTEYKWNLNQIAGTLNSIEIKNKLNSIKDEKSDRFYILVSLLISHIEKQADINSINNQNYKRKINQILNSTDDNLIKGVSQFVEYFKTFGDILNNIITLNKPLIKKLAEYLILNHGDNSRLNIKNILKKYDQISKNIDCEPKDFIRCINDWHGNLAGEVNEDNIFKVIPSEMFLYDSIELDNEIVNYIRESYKKSIVNKSKKEILEELKKEELTYTMKVLKILLNKKTIYKASNNLRNAYKDYIIEIVENLYTIKNEKKELLNSIYKIIDKNKLITTFKNIRDLYIRDHNINLQHFLFFMPKLKKHAALNERSDDVIRRIILPVIDNKDCLEYIIKNENSFIPIINNADESKIDLVENLDQLLEDGIKIKSLKQFIIKINEEDLSEPA